MNGTVRCRCYKGTLYILGRCSEIEKLYDVSESSMDELGTFELSETGFLLSNQGASYLTKEVRTEEGGVGREDVNVSF